MKKLFFALMVVLFATSAVAQTGLTCEDPIPVDENYSGTVSGACTRWYTANTYDLPLTVHFIPDNANSQLSPEIEVDFTCTPGVYADPKLDSLINLVDDYDVTFPIEMMCDRVIQDGKVEWDLSVNKNYREQLAEFGIPYNVQAFIKVKYYESGRITLKPDPLFKNCMENAEYLSLGDTIDVVANDADRVFVLPYTDWQEDSIRFVWIGEQSATIYAAVQRCDFEPNISNSDYVKMTYTVSANSPKKLYSPEMKAAIKNNTGGGLFYGKVLAGVSGKLVVEKIPMAAAQGGATIMEYGNPIRLAANETSALFCFPRTWEATQFQSVTNFGVTMYVSNTSDFTIEQALDSFTTIAEDNMRSIYLSNKEMEDLTKESKDDYIYVRFRCATAVSITPEAWMASDCAGTSYLIKPNDLVSVKKDTPNTIYRLRYDDFVGYDLTLKWSVKPQIIVYIADACDYSLSSTANLVLDPAPEIKNRGAYLIDSAMLSTWASRVDADGYLYVRFEANGAGKMTFITDKPAPVDPEVPVNECVANSIELKAGNQLTLNLDSAFTVYRINYAEWVAQNVTFRWSGETDLHTFIAETCQFAVAPYNKYVVDYIAIPTNGEFVLDVATLSAFAGKVDEDGYLYIRFLTEKEGNLSVTNY